MKEEKINNYAKQPRILVAPLDWGLGHATRCIPIIRTLLKYNAEVVLAANGTLKVLFANEFPQVQILDLDGYNVTYTKRENFFVPNLIKQLPVVVSSIRKERKWLQRIIVEERIDAVISDNRPGLYHETVPCVYITHQLQIQTGRRLTDTWLRNLHYAFIDKFQQCWIPDNDKGDMLAGNLSHPISYPKIPFKYLGLLSRFERKEQEITYDFLLLISGPEPQRSIFERKLLEAFNKSVYSFALVRGIPLKDSSIPVHSSALKVFDHLAAGELGELIQQSKTVVTRAGYSTIMDLAKLQKAAVLIPTPGQTEQEYLANYLNDKKIFACIKQAEISLEAVEKAAEQMGFNIPEHDCMQHEKVIEEWLSSLPGRNPGNVKA